MISVIVCSVDPEKLESLQDNIARTIGVEYEIIAFDNSTHRYGITKVYNLCARKARYNYLCFVHEDILFYSQKWGPLILPKLMEPTCGVIGFAGSSLKSKAFSGWAQKERYNWTNYIQRFHKKKKNRVFLNNIPPEMDYREVVVLDGMCLFVRKEVWKESFFNETILQGFHGYDLDFCLRVKETKRRNYICNCIVIEHFSLGSYNKEWVCCIKNLHQNVWRDKLPVSTEKVSPEEIADNEEFARYIFAKYTIKSNSSFSEAYRTLLEYSRNGNFSYKTTLWTKFLIHRVIPLIIRFHAKW